MSDDELIDVQITSGDDEIILATQQGMAIRFHEGGRPRRWAASRPACAGIRLREGDRVVGMVVIRRETRADATLLVVSGTGRGKRTDIDEYRFQSARRLRA